jgi:hypothetical protein
MARKLTQKQKNVLDGCDGIINYEALPDAVKDVLEDINDYETLWSDAERYLWDNETNKRFGKK